jgi:hypothetical protein
MIRGTTITVKGFPWGIVIGVSVVAAVAIGGGYWYYRSKRRSGAGGLQRAKCPCEGG